MQFCFTLAEHLHKTVGEVQQMDAREFQGWVYWLSRKENK